ncbi:MAG: tetratricopeptide repeat protein [Clostridiaceae bacterium]
MPEQKSNNRIMASKGKVLKFERTGEYFFRRGLSKLDNNNLLDALANYRLALEHDPQNAEVRLAIAETLTEMGRFEESNRVLMTFFYEDGERPTECYFGMGCNFLGLQEYTRARESFSRYVELEPDGEFSYEAYDMLDAIEEGEASGLISEGLAARKAALAGKELIERGDFKRAISVLKRIVEKEPELSLARNNLGLAYFCDRDYKRATAEVGEILKNDPGDIQAHCNLAVFLRAAKDEAGVQRELEFLKNAKSEDADELNRLSATLMEFNEFEAAYPLLKQLFRLMPYDAGVVHRLSACAFHLGDFRRAVSGYDRLLKIDAQDSVARYYRGVCRAALSEAPKRASFLLQYQVPPEEMLLRIHKLNEYVGNPRAELQKLWQTDGELPSLIRWGTELPERSVKQAMLSLVASFGDKRAELFLRDFVLQSGQPGELKRDAFGFLKQLGAKEPYLGYIDGELVQSRVFIANIPPEKVPGRYREVMEVCFTGMQSDRKEETVFAAAGLWSRFLEGLPGFPEFSVPQVYAMAAALEYAACRETGEIATKAELCHKYEVSLFRFNNALAKLKTTKKVET